MITPTDPTQLAHAANTPGRVLHVLEATLGGTRRYLDNVIAATSDAPYRQGLAFAQSRADANFEETLRSAKSAGWACYPIRMSRSIRPILDLRAVFRLRQVIKEFRPDIVHCHSSKAGGIGRLAALTSVPSPAVAYSPHALATSLSPVYLVMERILARFADLFIAVSQSERSQIIEAKLAGAERVAVVSPVVDTSELTPQDQSVARRELGLGGGFGIVGVGRLTEQKDPLAFVRIVRLLTQHVPDLWALWVGDGGMRARVQDEIRSVGLEGVIQITGWQTDVRPYMAASDLVLSTARYESFGYVVPEALAMGRPVVATAVTGTIDILEPWTALALFEPDDLRSAVSRVVKLARNPALAARYGEEGRQYVHDTYSREQMQVRLRVAYGRARGVRPDLSTTEAR